MLRDSYRVVFNLALIMGMSLAMYLGLRSIHAWDINIHSLHGHFNIVSIVSFIALTLAVGIGIIATRLRNLKMSFLSLSYVSLAALFVVHGLATPGMLMQEYSITGSSSQLSILLASFWLGLSAVSSERALIQWFSRWQRWLVPVWFVTLLVICTSLWVFAKHLQTLPLQEAPFKVGVTLVIFGLSGWTMYHYLQTYLASRFPLQLAIVYSAGWMCVAQFILVTSQAWKLSWWSYHLYLGISLAAVLFGIFKQYRTSGSLVVSLKQLFQGNPFEWIRTYMSPAVKELILTTESRDAYTAGHNYRVALYALKLAEEMNVSAVKLRAIAQGGLVHDVGKLTIPNHILNKPGKLTDEERAVIQKHPITGYNLCSRLGFLQEELSVIRSHHERWDGTGYPDQLAGKDIPYLARITAIADVYDALTSTRSYRAAMSHEEALEHLARERGKHFDPECVTAFLKLADEQRGFFEEMLSTNKLETFTAGAARQTGM